MKKQNLKNASKIDFSTNYLDGKADYEYWEKHGLSKAELHEGATKFHEFVIKEAGGREAGVRSVVIPWEDFHILFAGLSIMKKMKNGRYNSHP